MSSVKDEIHVAIKKLNLSPQIFRELPDDEGESVYRRALRHFVPEGEPRWWWEHFPSAAAVDFPAGDDDQRPRHHQLLEAVLSSAPLVSEGLPKIELGL